MSQDRPLSVEPPTEKKKEIRAILIAKTPHDAVSAYSTLFKEATTEEVRRLQANPSDTIAVQAAWQQIELAIPEKPPQVVRPDSDKLARFLGYLEGRARLQAPQWWAAAILDARANRRGNVYAGGITLADYREMKPSATALPPQAKFDLREGKPVVRVGSEFAIIPDGLREKLGSDQFVDGVCALVTNDRVYLGAFDSVGYPYKLACVDRSSAKVRWVADVWGAWWGNFGGQSRQWVEVTEQGDRVAVFGVSSVGFHVEAFRIDDGANVLRFSNSYWMP